MPEDLRIWVALLSGSLALLASGAVAWVNRRSQREQDQRRSALEERLTALRQRHDTALAKLESELHAEREHRRELREQEKVVARFGNPLMHAAYDLQSRIYNTCMNNLLDEAASRRRASSRDHS